MEGYETEINELRSFLSSLEGFNQRVCDSSNVFSEYISIFHSYIPNLISLSSVFYHIFEQPDDIKNNKLDTADIDHTLKYNQIASQVSNLISLSATHIVGDEFTTTQVQKIRELFLWFTDIAKTFIEFNPKPGFIMSKPTTKFHKKLNQQFSKIVVELAKSLDSEPTDLQTLQILPSSFPHHIVAFSNLLCRIVDVQQHLFRSKFSIRAENQNNSILLQYPTPAMLEKNETFNALILLQNKILNQIRNEKQKIYELYKQLDSAKKEFIKARKSIGNIIQSGFINKREANISILEEMVQCETRYKTFQTAKVLCSKHKKFETNISFDKEVFQEDQKLNMPFAPESIGDIIKSQIISLNVIKERMTMTIMNCKNYLDLQNKRIKEMTISNFVPKEKRRSDLYQFRQIIDSIRKCGTASLQAVLNFTKIEESVNAIPVIDDFFFLKSTNLINSCYMPAVINTTEIENSLNKMIQENKDIASSYLQEILDNRKEIDLLNAVNETIKYKKANPSELCPKCERERSFILLTCGHTFCEDCYQRIVDEQLTKCPYPSCEMPFTPDDICQINWED